MTEQFPNTADIAAVHAAVAIHLTQVRPTEALAPDALLVCIGAESYKLLGRSFGGRTAQLARAARAAAPDIPDGMPRGKYALLLADAVTAVRPATGKEL